MKLLNLIDDYCGKSMALNLINVIHCTCKVFLDREFTEIFNINKAWQIQCWKKRVDVDVVCTL